MSASVSDPSSASTEYNAAAAWPFERIRLSSLFIHPNFRNTSISVHESEQPMCPAFAALYIRRNRFFTENARSINWVLFILVIVCGDQLLSPTPIRLAPLILRQ